MQPLSAVFKMPPAPSNLLRLLMDHNVVSAAKITEVLRLQVPKIAICKLKRELKKWDVAIHNRRRVGWWLDDETKAKIRHMAQAQG